MWCSLTVMISLVACAAAAPRCASLDDVIQSRSDLARLKELKRTIPADVQREFAQRNGTQLTFFAPDDAAWAAVSAQVLANASIVKLLLDYHTVLAVKPLAQLVRGTVLQTTLRSAPPLKIQRSGNDTTIMAARSLSYIIMPDISTCRGVMHVISTVLLPPEATLA